MRNKKFIVAGIILIPVSLFWFIVATIDLQPSPMTPEFDPATVHPEYRAAQIGFAILIAAGAICLGYGLTHRK